MTLHPIGSVKNYKEGGELLGIKVRSCCAMLFSIKIEKRTGIILPYIPGFAIILISSAGSNGSEENTLIFGKSRIGR